MALGSTQPLVKMSTRNIPGVEGGRCVWLISLPSRAERHEIWESKPPGTLWATPGLLRDCFTFKKKLFMLAGKYCDQVCHKQNRRFSTFHSAHWKGYFDSHNKTNKCTYFRCVCHLFVHQYVSLGIYIVEETLHNARGKKWY
jgi:hypothetical protein